MDSVALKSSKLEFGIVICDVPLYAEFSRRNHHGIVIRWRHQHIDVLVEAIWYLLVDGSIACRTAIL